MILRKEQFLHESVNLLFLWKTISMKNLPLIFILVVSWDDDWRSRLEGVDMGRGCVVVIMLSVQCSFLWMFCRSKGTENHSPFPNALFFLPSHLISSNLTPLHFLRNHPCAVPQDWDKALAGPSAMKASVTLLFFSASGSGRKPRSPTTPQFLPDGRYTMCEELATTYVCVLIHYRSCPLNSLKWREKKAALAYWDGGGLLTARPITICLFTRMQMFEKCCKND